MSRDERILQRKLSCQIRRIDGFIESVDSIIEADETIRLEIMGEELKEIKEKIEKLYDELFSLDEVDIDKESEAYDGSMNKIGSLRVKIENERKLKDKLADIKPNGSQANIKLPQFDLPIYDGDIGNWINFKELFLTTIDAHPGLTNIQKLQYLNSAVKGEAARLIRGFPLLSENYGQAWSTLLSRYDNPRELAYAQVSKIFSLRAIKNPSAKCLHEFMDVCNEAIRNLETLELKRNQLVDVILVHFLQQKLSENLRLDWELSVDNTLPSYDKFIAFISRHARGMSCAVRECSKREETTGSRFPKCQSYGMLIEKSDTCILCKSKHHPLYMCNLFCKMPLKEKLNVVKGHKLCFNCLRKGHFSWNCRLNQRCKVCKGKHHMMIHYDKPSTEGASAQVENTTPKEHESAINLTNTQQANCNDSHVLLATTRIKIKNGLGKLCTCRALLDSGSQVTMITKGCCERLGLVQRKSDRMIIGVGNTPVQHSSSTVSVTFCPLNNSEEFSVEAVVTGVLTSEIPNFRLKDPNWPTLKSLKLADPEFYIQAPIDMILGADIYTELMLNGSISLGEGLPMAINTRLGWVLLGKLMGTSESNTEVCNLSLQSEPELEFVMKRFWETESVPSPDLCTQDEDCERLFSNNHGRDSHGRYWVKLPFRQHRPLLGESREKALRRFLSLEGKLCKNVKLYDQYRGFMKEYEHLNLMERVPIAEVKRELCRCYYMPHHPEDADYQRILWKPSPEEPVVDYRLLTVTYGTTSAPFLAMRTLQQLAEDEGQNYPEASRVTLNDFYVDDLLTGAQTIAETKELIDQLTDLMKKGGFHLRKWNSNCHEIVSHVEEMNEEKKINLEKGAISKILGIVWDHVQDTFRVNITLPEEVVTKRDLLSNIARIFDPLGFLSPTTVAMANLQRQTAVKEVEDLEGLPVYHRAILKENGDWPEVTKAIQCSYPKVFVGDGTHLYLLIEDVESLDGPNVRSVLYQYHIPHKKWIWRRVNGFAPIVISKSIVYASHDKRVYFVGGRIHSRGNKVTCTDNIVRVKLKEGRASVLVKSRKSPLTDLLVLAMTFAPSAFLFMLAETRDHSTCKVFSYHLLNKDWHLIGSNKIFWKEKFLSLQICYTNKKLLLFPRMQWEQHFCNLYNYRLQTDSWGCYTTIPILGEKEGYPKNINHFTIVQDWVRAVFVHAGKESKYLWTLNLKSKQWTELPTYVKYRDSQYTAVALDLVFILGPADKEHETAEKYLSFFKTRRCELLKFGLLPESTYDLLRSWLRFPLNLNQGSADGGISERKARDLIISPLAEGLLEFLEDNSLTIINGRSTGDREGDFTYVSERGSSTIDYCIVSQGILEKISDFRIETQMYSDHLPLILKITVQNTYENKSKVEEYGVTRYRWTADGINTFKQELKELQVVKISNLDSSVNTFTQRITEAMSTSGIMYLTKGAPGQSKPWFDKNCYEMKKLTKESLKEYRRTNRKEDLESYALHRKKYLGLLNDKRKKYIQEKQEILRYIKDSKSFWKTIALFKRATKIQGEITVQEWHEFYCELMSIEEKEKICNIEVRILPSDPILDPEITSEEIGRAIRDLKNNKASGPDDIPNEIIKVLPDSYMGLLEQFYNRALIMGHYPTIWTKSIIHPIFKSGDKDNPSNYRGIALISNLSKLFTTILRSRLNEWVERRNVIPENQAGFRRGRSCADLIFTLTTLIQLSLRKKRGKLYVFFVDLRKAFDTVPHSLLWKKLTNLGVSYQFIHAIRNYYEQATVAVRWRGSITENIKIHSGVLQGEPLSPLLFILFMTDLIKMYDNSDLTSVYLPEFGDVHLLMYADDIAIIGESRINLQKKINILREYLDENYMTLNESKSKVMVFRNGGKPSREDRWYWNGKPLMVTRRYNYLGYPLGVYMGHVISCSDGQGTSKCERQVKEDRPGCGAAAGYRQVGSSSMVEPRIPILQWWSPEYRFFNGGAQNTDSSVVAASQGWEGTFFKISCPDSLRMNLATVEYERAYGPQVRYGRSERVSNIRNWLAHNDGSLHVSHPVCFRRCLVLYLLVVGLLRSEPEYIRFNVSTSPLIQDSTYSLQTLKNSGALGHPEARQSTPLLDEKTSSVLSRPNVIKNINLQQHMIDTEQKEQESGNSSP
ncbi:hypothetical protein LAZ67_1008122 [Cordylochernes scorpioides]|uniref:Uncharacterized protein n=1 Tax=Cordylochernes scorpioides TaxID=51811 RepID=A0ABY6K1J3_9ARAC|nr:hypothetical protein LAZ67_1008122 [Cordylochernes scorpioides]